MKKLLILIFSLPVLCWGMVDTLQSSDLPKSVTSAGNRYVIDGAIHSDTNGVLFGWGAYDDTLEGAGGDLSDTLYFGEGNGDYCKGVYFNQDGLVGAYNILIRNLVIMHNPVDTTTSWCNAIYFLGGSRVTIENCILIVYGYDANVVRLTGGSWKQYNIHIKKSVLTSHCTAYTSRAYYDGAAIKADEGLSDSGYLPGYYHLWVDSCDILNTPHAGIAAAGVVKIDACSTVVDMRNDFYSYPSDDGYHSSANAAGADLHQLYPGSYVKNSYWMRSTDHLGAHGGLLLQVMQGISGDPIEISGNYIEGSAGKNEYYGFLAWYGIRLRWGNDYYHIFNNTIKGFCGDTTQSAFSNICVGIDLYVQNQGTTCDWLKGREPDSAGIINNNHIESRMIDTLCARTQTDGAFGLRISVEDRYDYVYETAACSLYSNYFMGSKAAVYFNSIYGDPQQMYGFSMHGDTLAKDTAIANISQYTWGFMYGDGENCDSNYMYDPYFVAGAAEDDNFMATGLATGDLSVSYTCTLYVMGVNDSLCAETQVIFVDAYNDTTVDTTNISGYVVQKLRNAKYIEQSADSTFRPWSVVVGDSTLVISSLSSYMSDTLFTNLNGDIGETHPAYLPLRRHE